jgi:hypothetical protein
LSVQPSATGTIPGRRSASYGQVQDLNFGIRRAAVGLKYFQITADGFTQVALEFLHGLALRVTTR